METKILTVGRVAANIRIPAIYNITYFIAEIMIYFDLSRAVL